MGLYVETPKISYVFTPGCGGAVNSTDLAVRDSGDLVQMVPAIGVDGGYDLGLNLRIAGFNPGFGTRATLASTSWTLPTTCFSVNLAQGTWSELPAQPTDASGKKIRRDPVAVTQPIVTPAPKRAVSFYH